MAFVDYYSRRGFITPNELPKFGGNLKSWVINVNGRLHMSSIADCIIWVKLAPFLWAILSSLQVGKFGFSTLTSYGDGFWWKEKDCGEEDEWIAHYFWPSKLKEPAILLFITTWIDASLALSLCHVYIYREQTNVVPSEKQMFRNAIGICVVSGVHRLRSSQRIF